MTSISGADTIIWVHGDCLSPASPAFTQFPDSPALFVFDEVVLAGYRLSMKRLVFLYECLLELPVVIRKGDVAQEILRFGREHRASRIVTMSTPAPRFQAVVEEVSQYIDMYELDGDRFVDLPPDIDLTRFSRYWRKAEREALRTTSGSRVGPPALPGFEDIV